MASWRIWGEVLKHAQRSAGLSDACEGTLLESGLTVGSDLSTVRHKEIFQARLGFRDSVEKKMENLRLREGIKSKEVCKKAGG